MTFKSSFSAVKPLPGVKKEFPNVSARVNTCSKRGNGVQSVNPVISSAAAQSVSITSRPAATRPERASASRLTLNTSIKPLVETKKTLDDFVRKPFRATPVPATTHKRPTALLAERPLSRPPVNKVAANEKLESVKVSPFRAKPVPASTYISPKERKQLSKKEEANKDTLPVVITKTCVTDVPVIVKPDPVVDEVLPSYEPCISLEDFFSIETPDDTVPVDTPVSIMDEPAYEPCISLEEFFSNETIDDTVPVDTSVSVVEGPAYEPCISLEEFFSNETVDDTVPVDTLVSVLEGPAYEPCISLEEFFSNETINDTLPVAVTTDLPVTPDTENTTSAAPAQVPEMLADAEVAPARYKRKKRPNKAEWNECYKRRLARRKLAKEERDALALLAKESESVQAPTPDLLQ